jgi:hypothetical protein
MKTRPKNIVSFVLRGLPPLDKLDQTLMRKLRKLADWTGSTVEDLMHEGILEFVAKCQAKKELQTKIIQLPKVMRVATKRRSNTGVTRQKTLRRHIVGGERQPRRAPDE